MNPMMGMQMGMMAPVTNQVGGMVRILFHNLEKNVGWTNPQI